MFASWFAVQAYGKMRILRSTRREYDTTLIPIRKLDSEEITDIRINQNIFTIATGNIIPYFSFNIHDFSIWES